MGTHASATQLGVLVHYLSVAFVIALPRGLSQVQLGGSSLLAVVGHKSQHKSFDQWFETPVFGPCVLVLLDLTLHTSTND